MLNRLLFLLFFVINFQIIDAQIIDTTSVDDLSAGELVLQDSIAAITEKSDVKKKKKKKKEFFVKRILKEPYPSPNKAALLSLILPGAGQAYNKKYWKIPIVYAGIGGLGYAIHRNGREFRDFREQHLFRVDGDPNTVDRFEGILSACLLYTSPSPRDRG